MENKSWLKKLIIFGIIIAVFLAGYCYDYIRMQSFEMNLVSISPEEPVADVKQQVTVQIKLTRNGEPVEGHVLFALAMDGGQFRGNRATTDENGIATLTYIPYSSTKLLPAKPVRVEVRDESNSIFLEVDAFFEFYINLKEKPAK